ncbi:TetR/AcrR family transcriptional regulator [Gordonia polyisoprenivorans]|uniref:TetR/AcrR family transcriptional regulator n=1 Tax=Gordonia polyisoprenivorans TaxID=84595 RepID=UPI001AD6E76D|nr:TetR/AcrR family transcriptional regulator [Gordonia polyisoprenivorans]QTI67813.1 TetR/AcrR family transcriptional regulator [Gordonia polyisoprenivorans]
MAWDTETTRRRLLDAGTRQFAAHGFAGARLDAIGRDAEVNKERVYRYFGDKRGLFTAVLTRELASLLEGVDLEGDDAGPEAIGRFAGALFDRCAERPHLPRLLAYESLELDSAVGVDARNPLCAKNITGIQDVVAGLDRAGAEQLLFSVISLVVGWWTLSALVQTLPVRPDDAASRRAAVVAHATAMADCTSGRDVG